ncbi:MAG: cupin domain-containing protein [Chitinophagales bacterium]|nr:cupin domain-containing protein [Chitinophagales bacterium]
MDLSSIIESGQVESYVFGFMDGDEKARFEAIMADSYDLAALVRQSEEALGLYAAQHARLPATLLKNKVLAQLNNAWVEHGILPTEQLPLLTRNANLQFWQHITNDIQHPEFEGVYMHTLRKDEIVEISLAWLSGAILDEHHDDLIESFLILEGSCRCLIGNEEVCLGAGDYIEIPLHIEHNVIATSEQPVKAVLQWLKVAA